MIGRLDRACDEVLCARACVRVCAYVLNACTERLGILTTYLTVHHSPMHIFSLRRFPLDCSPRFPPYLLCICNQIPPASRPLLSALDLSISRSLDLSISRSLDLSICRLRSHSLITILALSSLSKGFLFGSDGWD
eukprot:1350364-Amorphochlora_amoeboformis.AAC.1